MINEHFSLHGHLRIWKWSQGILIPELIFDKDNLITDEGRGGIMDHLFGNIHSPALAAEAVEAIMLTFNTDSPSTTDTFTTKVADFICSDGVLHAQDAGQGKLLSTSRTPGTLSITMSGTIGNAFGNATPTNIINSIAVVLGASNDSGYGNAYVPNGNEKILSRILIGEVVKTSQNSYTFEWVYTIS